MAATWNPVLVIDDQPDLRTSLADFIRDHGYGVETAANGWEALQKLRAGLRPCIIVMDLMMPEMNGFMFRTQQMLDPQLANIPVVAHSGVRELSRYAQLLEANAYIEKPAELEYVMSVIRKHCLKS
ncbi:MAG TPA: response regulator [Terriglobales bacterium]|nr:response regulator [Terriglobales bacterium]